MTGTRRPALRKNPNEKILRPVHPSAGLTATYRSKLDALIEEMATSVNYWVSTSYRANQPNIAQDELPASAAKAALRKLTRRWQKKFNEAAPKLADYFAAAVEKRSSTTLRNILKEAGISVEFTMTAAQRDILNATINQNVALIKSIPQQYLAQVEGAVMRSVQTGRDLGTLAKELEQHYGVTKRRAAFIAKSQNNMATASMTRARQVELGLTEAIWVHSHGGKEPRPSHVKAGRDKQRYQVDKGWYDPDAKVWTWPGVLLGCRCVSRSVIKGFS
jgi:uncharacterized protein with gpF-like domain